MSERITESPERIAKRLVRNTKEVNGCWVWQRFKDKDGYAQSFIWDGVKSRTLRAARLSYEVFVGKIPGGLVLDHLCRNRACINPKHLEPVTIKVNTLRGNGRASANSRKTHCPQGHEYTPKNTYIYAKTRRCRTCAVNKTRLWRKQKKYAKR